MTNRVKQLRVASAGSDGTTADDKEDAGVGERTHEAGFRSLERIVQFSKMFGVYTHTCVSTREKALQVAYAGSVIAFEFYLAVAHATKIQWSDPFGPEFFYKLVACVMRMYFAINLLIPSLTLGKMAAFRKAWSRLHDGNESTERKLTVGLERIRRFVMTYGLGLTLTMAVGSTAMACFVRIEAFYSYIVPLDDPDWTVATQSAVCFASILPDYLMEVSGLLFVGLYMAVWFVIRNEFQNVTRRARSYARGKRLRYDAGDEDPDPDPDPADDPERSTGDLEHVRLSHDAVCSMVSAENGLFQHMRAGILVVALFSSCLTFYNIANVDAFTDVYVIILIVSQGFSSISGLAIILVSSVDINDKAHEAKECLFAIDQRKLDSAQRQEVQLFISRLVGPQIGYTAGGLFVITREAILSMIGLVLTYAVVLFQFGTSPSVKAEPLTADVNGTIV